MALSAKHAWNRGYRRTGGFASGPHKRDTGFAYRHVHRCTQPVKYLKKTIHSTLY